MESYNSASGEALRELTLEDPPSHSHPDVGAQANAPNEGAGREAALWRDAIDLVLSPPKQRDGLAAIAGCVLQYMGADTCAVYLLDHRTEELVLSGSAGEEVELDSCVRLGQGITGLAAFQRRAVQMVSTKADPRYASGSGAGTTSPGIVAVPIYDREQLVGVMDIHHHESRALTPAEMESLESAVPRLVVALMRSARARETLQRRTYELQALNELGQAMNAGLGLDETLELIAARAAEALGANGASVRLVVEDGTLALATMVTNGETGFDSQYEKRIAEYVASMGEPILIDDVRVPQDPARLGSSMVCVPLVLKDRVVGTLSLFDKVTPLGSRSRLFGFDDLNMLFALSSQIAAEIEDIRLTIRLQELVRTEKQQGEKLRGLFNRSQAFLQSISDGLLAIDRSGTVEEINTVASRILGLEWEDVHRHRIDELVEDKPPLQRWVDSGGQFSNRVVTLRTPHGQVAAVANLQPVMDGGQAAGAVLTFREMGEVGRFVNRMIGAQRTFTFDDIIGESPQIEKTKELARIAAGTGSNILIQGETGTGKEVFAQSIHNASSFSEGPFVAVNCAAIPRDLIESELFGYVEGAFTGASRKGHLGKLELASGGTLFLDEIGDIPPDVQVKLLRVLQEKTIVRVGGDRTIPIDCRLVAATNRDLHQAVAEGRFRRDLLYRVNVIAIEVPPLRERVQDIPPFVARFVTTYAERNGKVVDGVEDEVMQLLLSYEWPGNVRELENVIEHSVAMVKGRHIEVRDLPELLHEKHDRTALEGDQWSGTVEVARQQHESATRQLYMVAMDTADGDVRVAAGLLGVSRATLYRRLKEHGLQELVADVRRRAQI